ncbi:MAG: response regulator [Candidatus Moranbacteria bacterium]|nr:response regulator [Candidatus Moranbacteria bacterium]
MEDKKKILIVEDDPAQRTVLSDRMKKEGYDIIVAEDGQVGLEKALSEHPNLILSDVIMPKRDGMSMLHELRQDSWGKNAKVFMLTNLMEKEKEATTEGVVEYLVKADVTMKECMDRIRQILEKE